jgi:two-component system C4-dicarboxylate transport sensor histidine kinase DctB
VDRLEKITENYLKLSRLSAGVKRRFDLGDVLEAVLATYAPLCEAQQIRVNWKRPQDKELAVFGDPELLEQVLGNLMRNSIQAIGASLQGKIEWELGSLPDHSQVWIRIEDNGPGIAPDYRSKIFTPFLTTRAQGTGLGLSFAKKVVEDHGGSLAYRESIALKGACFEVRLPEAESAPTLAEVRAEGTRESADALASVYKGLSHV